MLPTSAPQFVALTTLVLVGACASSNETTLHLVADTDFETTENSGEPNLFVTHDGKLLMSWLERTDSGHALNVAVRQNGEWSAPITAYASDKLFANWADFPSIAATSDGTWIVHWLEKVADAPYAYHTRVSQSTDGGTTWSTPMTVHQDRSPTEHGFLSMSPGPNGSMDMIWLDGRETGSPDRGPMAIWGTSIDRHGKPGPERPLDEKVCDCCQTALIRSTSGLVAAYRDRSDEEIRDIAVRHEKNGHWSEPIHVGNDNWHITGCPVNGPSLASAGDTVAIAWFTAPERNARVQVAFSFDGGRSFGDAVQVDDGFPLGRVDIEMLDREVALVSWLERVGDDAEVRLRVVSIDGSVTPSQTLVTTTQARQSGFPRMAKIGNEILFAHRVMNGEVGNVKVRVVELN